MKTELVKIEELKEMIEKWNWADHYAKWKFKQKIVHESKDERKTSKDITYVRGSALKIATYNDIKITYTVKYKYNPYNAEDFSTSHEGMSAQEIWNIEGLTVIGANGVVMTKGQLSIFLADFILGCERTTCDQFAHIYFKELEVEQNCIDTLVEEHGIAYDDTAKIGEESIIFLKRHNGKTIKFLGELIAEVEDNGAHEADKTRITLKIFKTQKNRYVCHQEYFIRHQRYFNYELVKIGELCHSIKKVKEFFDDDSLADELYNKAGI